MRNFLLCFLIFFAFSSFAQTKSKQGKSTPPTISLTKGGLDKRFIGSWSGSEKDRQQEGLEKHWIQHRFEDGTFLLIFTVIRDCEVETNIEKGRWWTVNNEFHELHFASGLTDVYSFTFLEAGLVKFKSVFLLGEKNDSYEFADMKLLDN